MRSGRDCERCRAELFGSNRILVGVDFGPLGFAERGEITISVYRVMRGQEQGRVVRVPRKWAAGRLWELIINLIVTPPEAENPANVAGLGECSDEIWRGT